MQTLRIRYSQYTIIDTVYQFSLNTVAILAISKSTHNAYCEVTR